MEILIVAVGRLKRAPEAELCTAYLERASRTGRTAGLGKIAISIA